MTVGVVAAGAESGARDAVLASIERIGEEPLVGDAATVRDAGVECAVAIGSSAVAALARAAVDAPVLPVDAGGTLRSVPGPTSAPDGAGTAADTLDEPVGRLVEGRFDRVCYPVLGVETSVGAARALLDLALVTETPAKISEYSLAADSEHVSAFRADGVVLATPAGSGGYTRAAGGAVVAPGTGTVSVVPIAPFGTGVGHWVVPDERVVLRVERDEVPVQLLADDTVVGTVGVDEAVRVGAAGAVTIAVVPASRSFFG